MKTRLFSPALWAVLLLALLTLAGCKRPADQPLEITGVFPADQAGNVPRNTAMEITFSAEPEALDDFFSISPALEGSFRYMDNVVAFLPSARAGSYWEYETTYTVTVKAGLRAKEGKGTLAEDFVFSFTIQSVAGLPYELENLWETFLPGDYPVLDLRCYGKGTGNALEEEAFSVSVHRLENGERYLKELYRAVVEDAVRVDTDGLPEVLAFTQTMAEMADPDNRWRNDIIFPEDLPLGWYVATATAADGSQTIQKLIQVQESAVYTQLDAGQAVLWFNSTQTGAPVPEAVMALFQDPFASMEPDLTLQGDENGILVLDLPEIDQENETDGWPRGVYSRISIPYSLTGPDGMVYYDALRPYDFDREQNLSQQYYGFLYLDRPIYRQEDVVKLWGVARPRKDAPKIDFVEVELYYNWNDTPIVSRQVPVSPDGVFTGELSYQDLKSGYFEVRVYPAGIEREEGGWYSSICSESASIAQYKKPLYTGSISTDKLYYQPGETIRTEVAVSLFDRTPAGEVEMMVLSDGNQKHSYTTDRNGLIQVPLTATASGSSDWGWQPVSYLIQALGGFPSDVGLELQEYVYVFPTTVRMDVEKASQGDQHGITVTANYIDFEKIPGGGQIIQDYEALRGAPAQIQVDIVLHKVTYTKVELNPYYDRYTKRLIPRNTYRRSDDIVKSLTETLGEDGVLSLPDLAPEAEDRDYYYVTITTRTGGYQTASLLLGEPWILAPEERTGHFHTFQVNTRYSQTLDYVSGWGTSFDFDEIARYQVMDNGIPLEEGRVMTNLLQRGLLAGPELGGTTGEIRCSEEKLPNFTLCGAYFDGTRIYPINPYAMNVTYSSRQLDLQVLPEQEDYEPGDTARVTLRLTRDGKPVSGGNVCLGVVDEAVFAVQEQYINMGWSLYRSVFGDYPEVACSYIQHGADLFYGEGGKGGGGGGDSVTLREKLQDTAAFLTGTTGADGAVTLSLKLPDNLTQWRLTAVALDKQAFWGQSRSQLYTTLPFRIDPILSSTFLSGDTIACTVRGFGREIAAEDLVDYTASIQGYDEPLEVTAQAAAGETIPLVFQKLPAGEYTITVAARCGEYSDGVKVPFTVKDSALTFSIHKETEVAAGLEDIQPTHYPVELSVYTPGQKSFMEAWSLLVMDSSGRADSLLAMASVKKAMTAFFGEDYRHPETDLSNVQIPLDDPDGKGYPGIRLYPYAQSDLETSAWTAVVAPDLVDQSNLTYYLKNMQEESLTDPQQAAVLMGLSALDELTSTQELRLKSRAQNTSLSSLESVYLIAGLSYRDPGEAQKLYAQIIAPKLQEYRGGYCLRENTVYETIQTTAGAMACAVLTGAADDAEKLMEYLSQNAATRYGTMQGPCQLQAALYLNRFQRKDSQLPVVSYTLKGKRETVTLPRSGCLRLSLDREGFAELDLRAEEGAAIASLDYTGTPDQLELADSPRITVTKTMDTPENQKHLGGETTVTIQVELGQELPYGHYRLVEWVPSNMRLREVTRKARDNFSYRSDEQLLTVDFYYGQGTGRTFTLTYTATSVLDTECTLERTYVYNSETMECGRTEKGEFLPSDYYYLGVGYLFRKE